MWAKVFSPEVQSVEIVQRSERRKRRARLYYMRFVSLFSVGLSLLGIEHFANALFFFLFSGSRSTIWAVWRISCPTISRRSRLLRVSVRRDGDIEEVCHEKRYEFLYKYAHLWSSYRFMLNLIKLFFGRQHRESFHVVSHDTQLNIYSESCTPISMIPLQHTGKEKHTSNSPGPSNPKMQ